jgi:hypothetical protein
VENALLHALPFLERREGITHGLLPGMLMSAKGLDYIKKAQVLAWAFPPSVVGDFEQVCGPGL